MNLAISILTMYLSGVIKLNLDNEEAEIFSLSGKGEVEWVDILAPDLGSNSVEVLLADGSRCDILLDPCENYPEGLAIEVDWCESKWKEAPGQSLLYSALTKRPPGVLLLLKGKRSEALHLMRCLVVCQTVGIILWAYDTANEKWLNLHPLPIL